MTTNSQVMARRPAWVPRRPEASSAALGPPRIPRKKTKKPTTTQKAANSNTASTERHLTVLTRGKDHSPESVHRLRPEAKLSTGGATARKSSASASPDVGDSAIPGRA